MKISPEAQVHDYILCTNCSNKIPRERVLGPSFRDIICGQCLKKEYGQASYDLIKNMVDPQEADKDKGQE